MSNVVSFEERFEERFRMQAWADFDKALTFCNEGEWLEALWIIETWLPICLQTWGAWKRQDHKQSLVQHTALTIMNGLLEIRMTFQSEFEIAMHAAVSDSVCACN